MDLIALIGEQQELVNQVIALSIKYSVLTPYTAFLVVEPAGGTVISVDEKGANARWLSRLSKIIRTHAIPPRRSGTSSVEAQQFM
jgi:hypothetical protein